jgi:hypothetical protein
MLCLLYICVNACLQNKCLICSAVRSSANQLSAHLFHHDRSVAWNWNRPIYIHYDRGCPAAKKTDEAGREGGGRYHRRQREQWLKLTWFSKGNVFWAGGEPLASCHSRAERQVIGSPLASSSRCNDSKTWPTMILGTQQTVGKCGGRKKIARL